MNRNELQEIFLSYVSYGIDQIKGDIHAAYRYIKCRLLSFSFLIIPSENSFSSLKAILNQERVWNVIVILVQL